MSPAIVFVEIECVGKNIDNGIGNVLVISLLRQISEDIVEKERD